MKCIFCEEIFAIRKNAKNSERKCEIDNLKEHLLLEHRFIISDIYDIANLEEYLNHWRNLLKTNGSLKNYCAVTYKYEEGQTNVKRYLMLCPDIVIEDKELRKRLSNNSQKREIVHVNDVVIAGPVKQFKKQSFTALQNLCDIDLNDVKTAAPSTRNKDERKLLNGYDCTECFDYYSSLNLSPEQMKSRLDKCSRHRSHYSPPKTPPQFWEINIPSTPECKQNGWLSTDS